MTYRKVKTKLHELAGNMALSNAQSARKLRRAARYANYLADLIDDDDRRRNVFPIRRTA